MKSRSRIITLCNYTDWLISLFGRSVSILIVFIAIVMIVNSLSRYIFNNPFLWSNDLVSWMMVAYVFLGGAFAMQNGQFIRVDVLYRHYSERTKFYLDLLVVTPLFLSFMFVLIYFGYFFFLSSYNMTETSSSGLWRGRVYPAKFMIPLGSFLLVIAWISKLARSYVSAFIQGEQR